MRRRPLLVASLLSLLVTASNVGHPDDARAANIPRPATGTRISPLLAMAFDHHARSGRTLPWFERDEEFEADGRLPAVIRFDRRPSVAEFAALTRAGASFDARPAPTIAGSYLARITQAGLAALQKDPHVTRVSLDWRVRSPRPLDASRTETGVTRASRALRAKDGSLLDGTGSTILDIDTSVFIFHPTLFRADGGYLGWTDVNANGVFDVNVDGVDLDGDGSIADGERLQLLSAEAFDAQAGKLDRAAGFRPDRDFLYCDTDGNGKRDYGTGFSEDTPAYGEPIFVLDDANGDGAVARSEKLARLKTSKIRTLRVNKKTYERGASGSLALVNFNPGKTRQEVYGTFHGTGVAGILVGGVPGVSRWLGLAPGADLVVVTSDNGASSVDWAIKQKPDTILTEYAPYVSTTLDGSSEEDAMLDAALGEGAVVVSPAGNLAGSRKHRTMTLSEGTTEFPIVTDARYEGAQYLLLSLHQRGATARSISLEITTPDGQVIPVTSTTGQDLGQDRMIYAYTQSTSRSTHEQHVVIYTTTKMPMGTYQVKATLDAGPPVEIDAYVGDEVTSWTNGATFDKGDDARTICAPSTGDRTISVGAYVLHDEPAYGHAGSHGALASYSSQGPRLDGEPKMGVAAPDNPISSLPPIYGEGPAEYMPFGGTSGAGPHVAASIALLRQLFPNESAESLRLRILNHAKRDSFVTADSQTTWGEGKLDFAAAAGLDIADGAAPKIRLVAPTSAETGKDVELSVDVLEGAAQGLTARWDVDYDGTPDTPWEALAPRRVPAPGVGEVIQTRVEVRDEHGNVVADTALVPITASLASGETQAPQASDDGCGCYVPAGGASPRNAGVVAGLMMLVAAVRRRMRSAGATRTMSTTASTPRS